MFRVRSELRFRGVRLSEAKNRAINFVYVFEDLLARFAHFTDFKVDL